MMLGVVHDESTDVVRLGLEPKSRNVDPAVLMESLFRQTDLEVRVGLNMNVLDADNTPRVMNLREVLRAFLNHPHEWRKRQTLHRPEKTPIPLKLPDATPSPSLTFAGVPRTIPRKADPK